MAREPTEVVELRRMLGRRLAVLRGEAGLTQNEIAVALHYDRTSVAHIETGRQGAPRVFWERVDRLLGANGALVAGYDELAHAKVERPRDTAAVGTLIDTILGILGPAAYEWNGPVGDARQAALHWLVSSDLRPTNATSGSRRVGQEDLDRLATNRVQLKALDNRIGGAAALPLLTSYLRRDVVPLLHGRYTDATGRRLMAVTAQLVLDAGWAAYDVNAQPFARRCMLAALRLAETAGDRLFGGRALAALAHQALHLGRRREAFDLASAAALGTSSVAGPHAVAMFEAMVACAAALLDELARCESALSRADAALDRADREPDPPSWLDFDRGGLAGHAARAYRDLRRTGRARRFAEEAIESCRADHARTKVQRQAILATTLVHAGEIEHACAIGHDLVDHAEPLRSGLVLTDVRWLAQLLPDTGQAAEFRARARSLTAAAPVGPAPG